jgi:hypothetical protein
MNSKTAKRVLFGTILCGLLLASGPLLAGARVVAGQWEHTMTTEGQTEPKKVSVCMTADEAASFNGDSKSGRAYFEKKMHAPCSIKTFELKGNTLSYLLVCGDRTIENTVTFHGETSEGVTVTKAPDGTHTMHVKSRRLGACQ